MNNENNNLLFQVRDLPLDEKLQALPTKPGVYRFINSDAKVIYIGKAANLRNRVKQYFQKSKSNDTRISAMISNIADVEITVTDNEVEALILEANLIKQFKPKYNILLKDDKSYPWIAITTEQYPRAIVTRRKNLKARYFGPYTDVKSMRNALKTFCDIFYIRSCNYEMTEEHINKKKYKVCLDYHIKKCEGPCEGLVNRIDYNIRIDNAVKALKGKIKEVISTINNEMNKLAESMRYEEAAIIREKINALKVYSEKQRVVDINEVDRDVISIAIKNNDACAVIFKIREGKVINSQHTYLTNVYETSSSELLETVLERYYIEQEDIPQRILLSENPYNLDVVKEWLSNKTGSEIEIELPNNSVTTKLYNLVKTNAQYWLDELELLRLKRGELVPHVLKAIQRDLRLTKTPRRIECFDISNIHGADIVASLVVFINGLPKKSEYRKYMIRNVNYPNDYASMKEVIERRYSKNDNKELPDLIMVDGGKGQISSAIEIIKKLDLQEIPVIGLAKRLEEIFLPDLNEPIILPRSSSSLRLLQQIRDETHRFAIEYHRKLRSKRIINTELENIKGIGKKRAKNLISKFGSIHGVQNATEEQIASVVGKNVANKICEYFKSKEKNNKQIA